MSELTQSRPYAGAFVPASVILQKLHDHAPAGHVTLNWLMSSLQKQSFGLITLVLAVVAAAPGISLIGGLLLLIPAVQMMAGRPAPTFHTGSPPATCPHSTSVPSCSALPMRRYLEKAVYPRRPTTPEATKRVVGIAGLMLSARLILTPIPLSNILPALIIALISLAYTEEDGLVLSISLLVGFVVIVVDLAMAWQIVHGAERIRLPLALL